VARRPAENPAVGVLLLEAGGSDDVPSVMEANQWPLNLASERNWGFRVVLTRTSTDAPCLSLWARSLEADPASVAPGNLEGPAVEDFIRDAAISYAHEAGTTRMGRDAMSVVDGQLKVYGIDNLRIADASIMPRVTTGNTMAPCVVIGERAGEILKGAHGMS